MKNLLNYATILLFILGYLWSGLFAQSKLEALEQALEQDPSTEERISILNELGENLKRNYPKSAFRYAKQAYELSQFKKVPEGIAASLVTMGDSKWNQGYYKEAYTYYEEGKTVYEKLGDSLGIAAVRHGFAIVDWRFGDFPKALEHEFKALLIRERNGDSLLMADSYYWLGIKMHELRYTSFPGLALMFRIWIRIQIMRVDIKRYQLQCIKTRRVNNGHIIGCTNG